MNIFAPVLVHFALIGLTLAHRCRESSRINFPLNSLARDLLVVKTGIREIVRRIWQDGQDESESLNTRS